MADKKPAAPARDQDQRADDERRFPDTDETLPLPSNHTDGQDSTGGNAPAAPADITPGALNVHDDSDDHDLEPDTKKKSS